MIKFGIPDTNFHGVSLIITIVDRFLSKKNALFESVIKLTIRVHISRLTCNEQFIYLFILYIRNSRIRWGCNGFVLVARRKRQRFCSEERYGK